MAFGIGGAARGMQGEGGGMRPEAPIQRGGGFQDFKHGGKVKRTGLVKAEKGEKVLTKKQQHERSEKKMGKR